MCDFFKRNKKNISEMVLFQKDLLHFTFPDMYSKNEYIGKKMEKYKS